MAAVYVIVICTIYSYNLCYMVVKYNDTKHIEYAAKTACIASICTIEIGYK